MAKRIQKFEIPDTSDANHEEYKLGCTAYNNNRYSEAKSHFTNAIEFWPEDYQAWWALGNSYSELGRHSKAEHCYRQALEYNENENEAELLFNLGNSLFDQERYSDAIEIYSKITEQSSTWTKAQKNKDLALKELR